MNIQGPSINPSIIPTPVGGNTAPSAPQVPAEPKDLTVLTYLNGTNNLEPDVVANLQEMEKVGSTANVNMVAQLSRAPQEVAHVDDKKSPRAGEPTRDHVDGDWSGCRRYYVTQAPANAQPDSINSPVVERLPDNTDMGSRQTLSDFVTWGMKNYPAKNYVLVVNDHGGGYRGCSWDDVHQSHLSMPDVKQALTDAASATGVKPNIVCFDACEMGQTEVAYELKNQTNYMVGSEEEIGGDGLPYQQIMTALTANPTMSDRDIAKTIVDVTGKAEAARDPKDGDVLLYSAIDESKIDGVRQAADDLGKALQNNLPRKTVATIARQTQHFEMGGSDVPDCDYRDLGSFAENVMKNKAVTSMPDGSAGKTEITQAAQEVVDSLGQAVIDQEKVGQGMGDTQGLSIYLPAGASPHKPQHMRLPVSRDDEDKSSRYGYNNLDMTHDGTWGQFIGWLSGSKSTQA